MATTSLPAPSLILRQLFARQVTATNQPLTPFIYGPAAYLVRYADAAEKALGLLGTYDPVGTLIDGQMSSAYTWPNRPAGSVIDSSFVKIYVDNAMLRYHQDLTQTATRVTRNSVRSPTVIYATNSYGTTTIGTQGATVGDKVLIRGVNESAAAFTVESYIIQILGDTVAAVVGTPAAASSNIPISSEAGSSTPDAGNTGGVTATQDESGYDGLIARRPSETYTVTVTLGGAAGTARVSVSSASGTDDQADVLITALSSPIAIGTRGLTVTFTGGPTFVVGDSWVISATMEYALPDLATAGTYTGTVDRKYIVEVTEGGVIGTDTPKVRVTSEDGGDTLAATSLTLDAGTESDPFNLGSFGLTATLDASTGLMTGDKFTVEVTASTEGIKHTLVLAHDFPSNVATDATADLEIELFVVDDVELPYESETPAAFQYTVENTQVLVHASATASTPKWINASVQEQLPILAPAGFGTVSRLYANYRAWYGIDSSIMTVGPNDDLDSLIGGPTDPDNPLKYAVSLARGAAEGESILIFNVGDPSVQASWSTALNQSIKLRACYGHVPLTLDSNILALCFASVQLGNGETTHRYRVLWTGSTHQEIGTVLDATKTEDTAVALATIEDNPSASGTQYTLVRLQSDNTNFLDLGIRPGDEIRFDFTIDSWGNEQYTSRTVDQVISATQITVTTAFGDEEVIPKRLEVWRTFSAGDLEELYSAEATARASDLVRYVLAPQVTIGSYVLPSYFAAAILAGRRAAEPAQRSLSRLDVPGISTVGGLELLDTGNLDRLAADGSMILVDDLDTGTVIVRHAVTTGDTDILALREESMVSARHANLFTYVQRMKPYVSQINLSERGIDELADLIRAELASTTRGLQSLNATPELGGQIIDLVISFIGEAEGSADTLKIIGTMELGRPGNYIDMNVLIS